MQTSHFIYSVGLAADDKVAVRLRTEHRVLPDREHVRHTRSRRIELRPHHVHLRIAGKTDVGPVYLKPAFRESAVVLEIAEIEDASRKLHLRFAEDIVVLELLSTAIDNMAARHPQFRAGGEGKRSRRREGVAHHDFAAEEEIRGRGRHPRGGTRR